MDAWLQNWVVLRNLTNYLAVERSMERERTAFRGWKGEDQGGQLDLLRLRSTRLTYWAYYSVHLCMYACDSLFALLLLQVSLYAKKRAENGRGVDRRQAECSSLMKENSSPSRPVATGEVDRQVQNSTRLVEYRHRINI